MHDIRAIRDDPETFDAAMARRGLEAASGPVLALDAARRARISAAETAQAEQNRASKEVGAAKARGDEGNSPGSGCWWAKRRPRSPRCRPRPRISTRN